jgi:hypothetical protein
VKQGEMLPAKSGFLASWGMINRGLGIAKIIALENIDINRD